MNLQPLYWNLPTVSNGISHDGNPHRICHTGRMYFDVTRDELLGLIAEYEKSNSLRSLSTVAEITYGSLVDFKRGKSEMLGDKNLRAVMGILRPEPPAIGLDENLLKQCAIKIDEAAKKKGWQLELSETFDGAMIYYTKILEGRAKGEKMEPSVTVAELILDRKRA